MEEKFVVKTFRVSDRFHGWVGAQGCKGESYEEILRRLTGYDESVRR